MINFQRRRFRGSCKFCENLGLVHMGRSYLGWRENISTSLQARSRLVMKITWKVTLCSYRTKLFPSTEISLVDRRDLGRRENFGPIWTQLSRLAGKLSVYNFTKSCHSGKLYPVSGITFLHMNRTKLFDLSKCFLASRDNFSPYEQALRPLLYILYTCELQVDNWVQGHKV